MLANILSLQSFYQTALGQRTQHLLKARLATLWPNLRGETVIVLGYGPPLLPGLTSQAASVFAFMPAGQGVAPCPVSGPNLSCLVDLNNLPLADNSIDRMVMLHALEGSFDPEIMLGEVWRVMKPNGRLVALVPNRMGLWAHSDHTPFGNGQPYSSGQIRAVLQNQGFCIEHLTHALYAPPCVGRLCLSLGERFENYAARLFPALGGILMVEASKQMQAPVYVKSTAQQAVFSLPFPASPLMPT